MSLMAYVIHVTCLPKTQIYILKSTATAQLFLPMTILLLPLLYSLLPLPLFVLQASGPYPATLHLFFSIHQSMIVIAPISFQFLYLLQWYLTRSRYFLSTDLRSQGVFH